MGQLYSQVKEIQKGDEKQIREFLAQFRPLIRRYLSILMDKDECVLQEALLLALQKMPLQEFSNQNEPDYAILSYIKKTVIRAAYSARRAEERQIPVNAGSEDSIKLNLANVSNEFERIELNTEISLLPEKQQAVIRYFYLYGYTIAEVARGFHISRQAADQLRRRALKQMKIYSQ